MLRFGTCRLFIEKWSKDDLRYCQCNKGREEHRGGYARRSFVVLKSFDFCFAFGCNHFKGRYHTKRPGHRGAVGEVWPDPCGSEDRNPNQNPCDLPGRSCWIEWEDPLNAPYSSPCPWSEMWQKVVGRHGVNRAPILASILRVGRHILFENNKKPPQNYNIRSRSE